MQPIRTVVALVALCVVLAACTAESGSAPTSTVVVPTTTTVAPTTTTTTPTTTTMPAERAVADGIGDPYYQELGNTGYDVSHYRLQLTYDPDTRTLTGVATITAVATRDLERFNLDLVGFEVFETLVDDAVAGRARSTTELTVTPAEEIRSGAEFVTRIVYRGEALPFTSEAIGFPIGWRVDPGGNAFAVGEPDGARAWFPSNDHPLDKAAFTFEITVPDGLFAAANGTLTDIVTDVGSSTYVWELDSPMATYLATVVVGDLQLVEDPAASAVAGVPIRNVLPPDLASNPPRAARDLGEMLAFFSAAFGPYPFETYGIAVVDGFEAALENQTLSLFSRQFATGDLADAVSAHELAHQWFGDDVSPASWSEVWLNEGFATYAQWMWTDNQFGPGTLEAIAAETWNDAAASQLPPPGSPPADDLFAASVYNRGALTLYALNVDVGETAFLDILRAYHSRYSGAAANTADFVDVASDVAGRDMAPLLNAWLYDAQMPPFPSPAGS